MTTTHDPTVAPTGYDLRRVALADLRPNPYNVRTEAERTRWTESTRVNGIQQPIVVREVNGGGLEIVAGTCRTASALAAGMTHADVLVKKDATDFQQATTVYVENKHREGLTQAQEAVAVGQLAAFEGVTQRQVAEITGMKVGKVRESIKIAGSRAVVEAARSHALTWQQYLVITEFDGDDEAVESLIATATTRPPNFDHTAADLRQDRAARAACQAVADRLTEAGVRVIDLDGGQWLPDDAMWIDYLVGPKGKVMTEEQHHSCPGHAAAIIESDDGFEPAYLCLDPGGCGHCELAASDPSSSAVVDEPISRGLSDEEKAERKRTRERNKAWPVTTTVRRKYLAGLLGRRTAPKGTLRYVTEVVLGNPHLVKEGDDATLATVLGKESQGYGWDRPVAAALVADATDARLPLVLFAQVAAAFESPHDDKTGWRRAGRDFAGYLRFLASTGYGLSDIEQEIAGPDGTEEVTQEAA